MLTILFKIWISLDMSEFVNEQNDEVALFKLLNFCSHNTTLIVHTLIPYFDG